MLAANLERLIRLGDVAKSRVHPEWRLIVAVILFCGAAAFSTSLWQAEKNTSLQLITGTVIWGLLTFLLCVWRRKKVDAVVVGIFLFLFGFILGQVRILELRQEFSFSVPYTPIIGIVERLDERSDGPDRLIVRPTQIAAYEGVLPQRIRVSVRTDIDAEVRTGVVVSFSAKLSKPNGPIVPGGYDFARSAYFSEIAADAIAMSPIGLAKPTDGLNGGVGDWVLDLRESIERSILQHLSGQAGGVAVALTVGFRNHLSKETKENLRRAGLSHLLAISGLHMGLVTVSSFLLFECLFAFIPSIALRIMPKKLAVVPTWAVAFSYLFLSGATTSTVRAFIMVSVALLAILTDRKVLSLRSVALAALMITCWRPESVLSIGFQMSFAATAGLVAFYEKFNLASFRKLEKKPGRFAQFIWYLIAIAVTSMVAQLSIAPFSLYHFQSLSVAGVLANILVLPVVTFLIMPALLVAIVTKFIGGLVLFAAPIGYGLNYILYVAGETATLKYAVVYTPQISDLLFIFWVVILLALLVYRNILLGGVGVTILLFFSINWIPKETEILISQSGRIVSVFREGYIYTSGGKSGSFRERIWRQYWGKDPHSKDRPLARYCDTSACGHDIWDDGRFGLVYVKTIDAVRPACASQAIILIPDRYRRYCKGTEVVITYSELERRGPASLSVLANGTIKVNWSRR